MKRSEINKNPGKMPPTKSNMPRNSKKPRENQRLSKRRRVESAEKAVRDAAEKAPAQKENKRWSVAESEVEPAILKEMGVEKLGDDASWYSEASNDSSSYGVPVSSTLTKDTTLPSDVPTSSDGNRAVLLDLVTPDNSQELCNKAVESRKTAGDAAKPKDIPDEIESDFFQFRRRTPTNCSPRVDEFSKLSDEIILMIFRYLPKKTLIRNALVCKRWQRISYDESLWVRLDLTSRVLGSGALGYVLSRGTTVLRLSQTEFEDPIFLDDAHGSTFKLQYLCLSMAVISEKGLYSLLRSCKHLKKLSLEHTTVNADVCHAVSLNTNLEVLNLASCYGVTEEGIRHITTGNKKLTALNLAWTELSSEALHTLITGISGTMQRLNISGCRKTLQDLDILLLVERCPELTELDASDCTAITSKTVDHVARLAKLEHLALSRCYSIAPAAYRKLLAVDSLRFLDVFSSISEPALTMLKTILPSAEINRYVYSSVARPTVGIRRTSIWGVRVRD